jgi:hypothetical protein
VFENRGMRMFGGRKVHNEELRDLYSQNDEAEEDEMGRACSSG